METKIHVKQEWDKQGISGSSSCSREMKKNSEANKTSERKKVQTDRISEDDDFEDESMPVNQSPALESGNHNSQTNGIGNDSSSDFSEDNSDSNFPMEISQSRQPQTKVVELVDIDSDSPEENEAPVEIPRRAGLRQRHNRLCFKEKDSESDSEVEVTPRKRKIKRENKADPEKGFESIDDPKKFLRKLIRNPDSDLMDKYSKCFIDGRNLTRREDSEGDLSALSEILCKSGHVVEQMSQNKFSWNEKDSTNNPLNVHTLLAKLCKNLVVLKLHGPFNSIEFSSPKQLSLPNLRDIIYTCGPRDATQQYKENDLYKIYTSIFKGACSLEKFEYTFFTLKEGNEILKALKDASQDSYLKRLKNLKFRSHKEDGVLKEHQITELGQLRAPLEYLELGNGLWADIQRPTIEKMLSQFSKLQKLIIHGFLQGDSYANKNEMIIHFPRLEKLTKLSIGAVYEFASVFQNPDSKRGNVVTIKDDDKIEFLKFQIRMPHMPSLKSIVLGNLINIDKLTFKDLPKLETFKVGGPWNATCNFLNESPHYGITELQFPDALKDSSLSRKIPELFPALQKLWIYLPSVVCLQGFFESMARAPHVKIEELYLKTQFDFESTLESCLLGRSTSAERSPRDINNLSLLRRYSHFEEYVKYYNIELPAPKLEQMDSEESVNSPGIGVLKSLKTLHMEHIPRVLRIPIGKYHWTDYRCTLTSDTIGYRKYPLSQKCIDELPVRNLETCLWPNFEFIGRNLNKFASSGLINWEVDSYPLVSDDDGEEDISVVGERKKQKLSVTIEPSMLRMAAFQVKKEEGDM